MSSPAKKKGVRAQKKEADKKTHVKEKAAKPKGVSPSAMVEVRHDRNAVTRSARGFSPGEVAQAGLGVGLTRKWGVLVDGRRRSILQGNVTSLKRWAPHMERTAEDKVESEVRKIERVAEREVRKVEKEVSKVEKEVVKKVEAPIKKRAKKTAVKPS